MGSAPDSVNGPLGLQLTNKGLEWAERIGIAWGKSKEAIFETGRLLVQAKAELAHGEWQKVCASQHFHNRTAERLMAISRDERLLNPTHVSLLPNEWGTLYEITRLDDEAFARRLDDGTINPAMERRDLKVAASREKRTDRERELGLKQQDLPQRRFNIVYADPPWNFDVWSEERGVEKSAQNQYPTMTIEQICALPVRDIVADDALLFLWITAPRLFRAPEIFAAWGDFEYVTNYVWDKERIATGYWNRNRHEILLLARRGQIPRPLPETLAPSVHREASTVHSAKPVFYCELIERQFPTLPKVELFRRGPHRDGWHAWGNEVEHAA